MEYVPSIFYIIKQRLKGRSFVFEFYCRGKKTLDLGCGEGEFLKHGKDSMWGVDTNERVIRKLKAEGYHADIATGITLPYKDEEFEVVHCHNVIEHLDIHAAYAMLQESARVLKKGGYLVLSSEIVTKKFWETFGHVKPYPPSGVIKLLRPDSREEFEGLSEYKVVGLFYIGDYHPNRLLYILFFIIGHLTPLFRREYFLILKKCSADTFKGKNVS